VLQKDQTLAYEEYASVLVFFCILRSTNAQGSGFGRWLCQRLAGRINHSRQRDVVNFDVLVIRGVSECLELLWDLWSIPYKGVYAMPLKDHAGNVERLQKGLGKAFVDEPWILNLPGKSVACKIDHLYYLVVMPAFVEQLGRFGGMFPDQVLESLVKSGNLITKAPERDPLLTLSVSWGGRAVTVKAAFLDADFIDRAVKTYGGLPSVLNVSELKINSEDKEKVEAFFEGKTPPQNLAYF